MPLHIPARTSLPDTAEQPYAPTGHRIANPMDLRKIPHGPTEKRLWAYRTSRSGPTSSSETSVPRSSLSSIRLHTPAQYRAPRTSAGSVPRALRSSIRYASTRQDTLCQYHSPPSIIHYASTTP
eukprot:3436253-Rhodomonas_salina.2